MFNYANIPCELKTLRQWVAWGGSKIPKDPLTGWNAMSNNPDTWGTFEEAVSAVHKFNLDGIGFMFAPPYFGVDLDKCVENTDFTDEFVSTLGSYAEYSKSGNGVHIICKGVLPSGGRRKGCVEMYSEGRFFITTGNLYKGQVLPIKECTESVKILHAKYIAQVASTVTRRTVEKLNLTDSEVVDTARQARNGIYFQALYEGNWQGAYSSQSDADLAFCNMLAFWTQCDYDQMDRIFRSSGLMRDKWNEMRGAASYGQITLTKAIDGCRDVYKGASAEPVAKLVAPSKYERPQEQVKSFDMTDTGNGQRMAHYYGNAIRYSDNRKRWYFWDGKCWQLDETQEIKRIADVVVDEMKREALLEEDQKRQDVLLKHANRTAGTVAKTHMIQEAEHIEGIAIPVDYFDVQEDMINMDNCIVNLRNGERIKHDPDYHMSRIGYAEIADGTPERWIEFINQITCGDKELAHYLQKMVGYTLTASTKEQCFFILYGNGNNGKSVFTNVIKDVLGTYGANADCESIAVKKQGGGVNSDIARLKGARMVTIAEPEEGMRLNESLVKTLTGGDTVTARFLYGDEFEYQAKYKIWMATNHKPVIRGTDNGIWRRVVMIPFNLKLKPDEIDYDLQYKLRQELPQIAKWCVDGCVMWMQEGLEKPACIREATEGYRDEMDVLARFCADCVIASDDDEESTLRAADVYAVYQAWAKANGDFGDLTATKFGKEFVKRYPIKVRRGDGWRYKYCALSEFAQKNYAVQEPPKLRLV